MKNLNLSLLILLAFFSIIGFTGCKDPEPAHEHEFSDSWSKDGTYHWHAATCEHTTEVSEKVAHTFGEWQTTKEATEEAEGSKERTCTVCGYTATEAIEKLAHTHKFATDWTKDETHHWHAATCEHTDEKRGFAAHTFGEYVSNNDATTEADGTKTRECSVCGHEDTVTDEGSKIHVHTFAEEWTRDASGHWHAATCEHTTEVSGKAEHTFGEYVSNNDATTEADGTKTRECSVCGYKDKVTDEGSKIHVHTFAEEWTSDSSGHWYASTCGHTTEVSGKVAHSFGDWTVTKVATEEAEGSKERVCTVCNYKEVVDIAKILEDFVLIPAGTFQMGSEEGDSDNKPVHQVTITKSFYMGKYEVTQAEYEKYCSYTGISSPSSIYGAGGNHPAYYVSWYDALVYCNKRSVAEGLTPCYSISASINPDTWGTVPKYSDETWKSVICDFDANGYRLPTEAEWEYAARAGDNTVDSLTYSGTSDVNKLGEYAWYSSNLTEVTHEVGTKLPNVYGLYDMSGNVEEWCWNWLTSGYDTEKEGGSDPTGASSGSYRVSRGGSWACSSDSSVFCTVSYRNNYYPNYCNSLLGFRVVRASSK